MPMTWNELWLHCSKQIIFIPWYWVHSGSTILHLQFPLLILTFPFPTSRPEWSRFHSLFSISSRLYFPDIDSWDWLLDPNDDRDQSGTMKAWWFHNAQRNDVGARRHFLRFVILTLIAILSCLFLIQIHALSTLIHSYHFSRLIEISRTKFLLRWIECNIPSW